MNTADGIKTKGSARQAPLAGSFSDALLAWYDRHARRLPWRVPPEDSRVGVLPDPYRVWLSEVMLQQTQVATVRQYFMKFVERWPTVGDLASAENEEVMKAWAGLGYYSRARNLKKCAETVAFELQGKFPENVDGLKKLPGIGDYTAAAIAAIAFQTPVPVMDGNVERIMTRTCRIGSPVRDSKPEIRAGLEPLVSPERSGDFAQALMDLGSTICTPRRPVCALCPVNNWCEAFSEGDQEAYPVKAPKAEKPVRRGAAFVIEAQNGAIYLRRRAEKGLLGGMTEIPGTDWTARIDGETGHESLPFKADWRKAGIARHTFTHFHLELEVWHVTNGKAPVTGGWWSSPGEIGEEALPTVMRKAISTALPDLLRR